MESAEPPLEDLRREIDRIDRAILDLLIERTDVVRAIGGIKGDRLDGRLAVRPAREAVILRRLVARGGRSLSAPLCWCACGASCSPPRPGCRRRSRSRSTCPSGGLAIWDLARDHFGSTTPIIRSESASQAIRAVSDGSTAVAVLPLPSDGDAWWLALLSDRPDRLRVFARLPFVAGGPGDGEGPGALALGRLVPEPSGDDLALLAIEAGAGTSRVRLRDLMAAAGLPPGWQSTWRSADANEATHLIEVESFVGEGDERLAALQARRAVRSCGSWRSAATLAPCRRL